MHYPDKAKLATIGKKRWLAMNEIIKSGYPNLQYYKSGDKTPIIKDYPECNFKPNYKEKNSGKQVEINKLHSNKVFEELGTRNWFTDNESDWTWHSDILDK